MKAADEQLNQKLQDLKNRTNELVLDCCEILVNVCKQTSGFIFLTMLLRAAGTITTNSGMYS